MQWTSPLPVCVTLVALVWTLQETEARPYRTKRVSDQRLAELETLLVLAKINREMQLNMPLGYGVADPSKLGRRKRTIASYWEPTSDGVVMRSDDLSSQLSLRASPTAEDELSLSDHLNNMIV
ncbi:uncharacterized protein LOC119091206 [Pollicipes pollicipes]|uniref:uncharacterized protein LOC119091206 n=1 Tax=Pollicipes pollicipes TaxID=41117 RepID=UPI0018850ECC|nr:uncharacterized protein LOC119091206 [Pollicipes pollicipes]